MNTRPPIIMVADGQYYNADDPQPEIFTLENMAISLANTCRWGGHLGKTKINEAYYGASPFPKKGLAPYELNLTHYSVAEHSVLGARYYMHEGRKDLAKLFLLHDALEPFIGGDIPTPHKNHLPKVHEWEEKGQAVVIEAFNLGGDFTLIKEADKRICRNESICLFDDRQEWLREVDPLCYETGFDRTMIRCELWDNQTAANEWYALANKLELKNKHAA